MSDKLFCFDPAQYADQFAKEGYVHIRAGVTEDYYRKMVAQVEQYMKKTMKEFAIGDKQQAMYQFPEGGDYVTELCSSVARVCALPADKMVLSERHIKAYDANAAAEPLAHKDRYASEISVGVSVHVKDGSTLVLYPYDETDINPFNTSVQLRASMSPDQYPEPKLKKGKRIEIKDAARDVIMFRGHKMWHLRSNPASTTMLYFKMNSFNCDPMGEDRQTEEVGARTKKLAEVGDTELQTLIPHIGRRVDFIHRHYDRNWHEVLGVVLWGEKHFSIDEDELKLMKAIDGKRNVGQIAGAITEKTDRATVLNKVRRLARRGVLDLVP